MGDFCLNRLNATKLEDLLMHESIVKLDEAEFGGSRFDYPYFANETKQRYKQSNPELYKFILKTTIDKDNDDRTSLATELIMDALNLSVKKLHVEISYSIGASWQTRRQGKLLVLPGQVFESMSLNELFAVYCVINKPVSDSITCLNIVSLNLTSVTIDDDAMRDILSRCLLIEYLDLIECNGLEKISLGKTQRNLKHCVVEGGYHVDFFEQGFTQYSNLVSLGFRDVKLEKTFFHDSVAKFPCVAELVIDGVYGLEETVEISLPSLKHLIVDGMSKETRWVFNVPCIRTFHCWGNSYIPPVNISSSSNEWESADIEFECHEDLPGLQEFLQHLSLSKKISLSFSLDYSCVKNQLTEEDISGVPCIHVENLAFKHLTAFDSLSLSPFTNHVRKLLSVCRPNFITVIEYTCYPLRKPSERCVPALEFLRESVTDHAVWKHDLKQVTFEMLFEEDETLREWRPILWDELIALVGLKIKGFQIRLKLEWHGGLN